MVKKKQAISDAELNDMFKTVQKNNSDLEDVVKAEPAKPAVSKEKVQKVVDKTKKEEYNQNKAFGLRKNPETRKWDILEIDYNIEDGSARIVDILSSETNSEVAKNRIYEATTRIINKLPLTPMRKAKR